MTKTPEHTPGPVMRHDMEAATVVTVKKPGQFIALCDGRSLDPAVNQANADHIIDCWNGWYNYPEIAAELKVAVNIFQSIIEDALSAGMPFGETMAERKQRADFYASEICKRAEELDGWLERASGAIAKAETETTP